MIAALDFSPPIPTLILTHITINTVTTVEHESTHMGFAVLHANSVLYQCVQWELQK